VSVYQRANLINIGETSSPDSICILCKEDIIFSAKDYGCVGRKGLATINEFTLEIGGDPLLRY